MMSTSRKARLAQQISTAIMRWQDATQSFDELVGKQYSLGGAERRCLAFLLQGPATATAVAKETALTPAAVTALIDRLEERGYVKRTRTDEDRRKITIEAAGKTFDLAKQAYGPIAQAGAELLDSFTTSELETIARFMEAALSLQLRLTERLAPKDIEANKP